MKSILPILLHVIIVLPLILPGQVFAQSPDLTAGSTPQPEIAPNKINEDKNDNPVPDEVDGASEGLVPFNQRQSPFPVYGPAILLQEDLGSSTIDLLPAYANLSNKLENGFDSFDILKEGDTYYLWVGSKVRTGTVDNVSSIEQRFESQDGLTWCNRTDTNLTRTNLPYKLLWGLRQVNKNSNGYEAWEEYYYEWSVGWALAIRYVTSTNGISWTVNNEPALIGSRYPTVIKNGATYHMWVSPEDANSTQPSRYRTNSSAGSGWGDWQTGGTLVTVDGNKEVRGPNRIRQLPNNTYQLFYLDGSHINVATSTNGISFTNQVTNLLDVTQVLSVTDVKLMIDFDVVEVEGEDWFYFTYCETYRDTLWCENGHIAVSRPIHYPDLEISKTATPAVVSSGELLTYTLTFNNIGGGTATGVVITDIIPISLTNVSVTSSGVAITDTGHTPGYVWQVQDLIPGAKGIITLTGRVNPSLSNGTNLINTATITSTTVDTDTLNNTASVTTPIQPTADLALSKVATPNLVFLSQPLTYTLILTNHGPSQATNLVVTDPLPANLNFISASPACQLVNDSLTCAAASLPPGAATTFTLVVSPTTAGSITNTASITATQFDPDIGNNTATVQTLVEGPTITSSSAIYLAIILQELNQPEVTFPVHIGEAIPIHPAQSVGEIFYTRQVQIPATLPAGGHFYFSSQSDAAAPALVDDELVVLLADGTEIFSHRVGLQPALIEVPRSVMEQMAGQTVTVQYRDVFGVTVWATDMWLIWIP